MSKLDGDQDTMQVLLQHILDEPSPSPPHLVHLSSRFNQHSLRILWHGIFPQAFAESIHDDRLTANRIVAKIIFFSLKTMHVLWIARCDSVHTSLSGGEQIEQLLLIREETEYILSDEDACAECPLLLLKKHKPFLHDITKNERLAFWILHAYTWIRKIWSGEPKNYWLYELYYRINVRTSRLYQIEHNNPTRTMDFHL